MEVLDRLGEVVAGFWLGLLGIAVLLSFPTCGFIGSLAVGAGAAMLVGGGTVGVIAFFVVAFAFGLFLSVFVWPHAKAAVLKCAEIISQQQP
jgi:hypothetical protein